MKPLCPARYRRILEPANAHLGGRSSTPNRFLKLKILGVAALLVACAPTATEVRPSTETFVPKVTATATPTEIPDPMLEASSSIPAEWGTIRVDAEGNAFYSSQDSVISGKNVPVQILEHTYEDGITETWVALVAHPEWPLFVQTETGEWQIALEYVDVKKPLVDAKGNPMPLTYEYLNNNKNTLIGLFTANGEVFIEDEVEYLPVAVSLDGSFDSPMYTKLMIPVEINPPREYWRNVDVMYYPGGVYIQGGESLLPSTLAKDNFSLKNLEQGEVFYARIVTENSELTGIPLSRVDKSKELLRRIFDKIMQGVFDPSMLNRVDAWITRTLGVSSDQ